MIKKTLKLFVIFIVSYLMFSKIYNIYQRDKTKDEVTSYLNNPSIDNNDKLIIEIPRVDVSNVVIKANNDFSNLKDSLVYYGNVNPNNKIIIFGHSRMGKGIYFNRIDELKVGDKIFLTYNRERFLYIIEDVYHVNKANLSILRENKNEKKIVLITCLKKEKDKRLVIIGSQK